MRRFLRSLLAPADRDHSGIERINSMRAGFARLSDEELRAAAGKTETLTDFIAAVAAVASRVLGQDMYDVQLQGALALARGSIAEMQTGEGKTLAAVPAVAWLARSGDGVHVMTANDYLARRDANWMGGLYRFLGFTVGVVRQGMSAEARRAAYRCDITYATANEIGFDVLRDRLALDAGDQVHRPFSAALIDEVDSILIDEARVPLVIAGGDAEGGGIAFAADKVVRNLRPSAHLRTDAGGHNVALTDAGIAAVENAFGCGNLFEERNYPLLTAVQDALHAHSLLRRNVDYLVKDGGIEMVDEFRGRIAVDRRWPAGIQTALEIKEVVTPCAQGMVLGSTTIQHLAALYPRICGMTGTASTQSLEFLKIYGLKVETIPTNRPMIRIDHPDVLFATRAEKERALIEDIRRIHGTGQPILVGTGSVEESERLSGLMRDTPHRVLNARNHEMEAAIVAEAGSRGAVTISTNMAGRGTDIVLGEGVAALGGLYVIGTNRHESRRIDNQLRGRAGRQGDPGSSRFFASLEDPLMVRNADLDPESRDPETIQRLVEGQHLDQRLFLHGYEVPIEGQRNRIHSWRQDVLEGTAGCESETERLVTLRAIDDLWADYLMRVEELRQGVMWRSLAGSAPFGLSLGRRDPHSEFLQKIAEWFPDLEDAIPAEIERRMEEAESGTGRDPGERGAVWTYLTTDQPFGGWTKRVLDGLRRKARGGAQP